MIILYFRCLWEIAKRLDSLFVEQVSMWLEDIAEDIRLFNRRTVVEASVFSWVESDDRERKLAEVKILREHWQEAIRKASK